MTVYGFRLRFKSGAFDYAFKTKVLRNDARVRVICALHSIGLTRNDFHIEERSISHPGKLGSLKLVRGHRTFKGSNK